MAARDEVAIRANEMLRRRGDSADGEEIVRIGRAFAAWIAAGRQAGPPPRVAVAADARPSSAGLREALVRGLASSGLPVADLGYAPPAVLLASMRRLRLDGGLAVTGGHRPLDWNGVRFYLRERPLAENETREILRNARGLPDARLLPLRGPVTGLDMIPDYIRGLERTFAPLSERLRHQTIRAVVAGCHGIVSLTAPHVLSRIGCRVFRLGCTLERRAESAVPNPSDPALLRAVGLTVRASGSDLGLALGGDGERFRVVDQEGRAVPPDHLFALLAADAIAPVPGAAVACDLRMSDLVDETIEAWGGRVVLARPGEAVSLDTPRTREVLLGGEIEGTVTFRDQDAAPADGTYAALRLIDILARRREEAERPLPLRGILPPERLRSPDLDWGTTQNPLHFHELAESIRARALRAEGVRGVHIEPGCAVRVRTRNGWGVLSRSPETGRVRMTYEGGTDEGFHEIGALFRESLGIVPGGGDWGEGLSASLAGGAGAVKTALPRADN